MYLRVLYKIHVFRLMSQHLCISRMLCKIHVNVAGFMSQHLYISGSSARSMSPDPCLRFRSQHPCVYQEHSGTSARSMSPDPYISVHIYLRILCKIHVSDSCLSIFIPQGPLQDPCLRIHVSASTRTSGPSARSMSPDPYVSMHMYLKLLCKIHVSGSVYQHPYDPYVSQDPLQDPCLRFMSQRLYTSGSSARSMSSDSCLNIHMYLRNLCKIHVSGSVNKHSYVSQAPLQDPCLRIRK